MREVVEIVDDGNVDGLSDERRELGRNRERRLLGWVRVRLHSGWISRAATARSEGVKRIASRQPTEGPGMSTDGSMTCTLSFEPDAAS